MNNTVKLDIPKSSEERVAKQFVQDTLRQFNSGDLSLNQTRDLIVGYFAPQPPIRITCMPPGQCAYCDAHRGQMMPPHVPSERCESGKNAHCSCDTCF